MDALKTLVPPSTEIKVLGKTRTLKPFTLKQTILLGRTMGQIKEHLNLKSDKSASGLFFEILEKLTPAQTARLIEILLNSHLNEEEKEYAQNMPLTELSELIKAISEVNDFKKIFVNFTMAMETINKTRQMHSPLP